ncbi:glycosyltransferase family 4 protein [Nitrosospira multiformis]|uniref:glycosyltransferase family 4 protein n=1 Tax=Nitrosospira multiformis TaxID=1231 RepID=UPI00089B4DF6|nr:glycosyltransferase family 4 protein [Nitrosospira multiformis]SDZ77975.1 Glycosyltransferase involved in cell wall bisynthesis [Nitrosospira multiformis]
MKKPRVVLVALHFAEYALNLALAVAESREVLLVLYRGNADRELGPDWLKGIRHPSLMLLILDRPRSPLMILGNARRLVRAIQQFKPDVIHYQEDPRDEVILGLYFLRSIPIVLTVHDPTPHSGTDSNRLRYSRFRLYLPLMRRAADIAITHGGLLADNLIKAFPHFKDKVQPIPHGPLGLFSGTQPSHPSGFRLLFFGRIFEYKGLSYFVDSVIMLRDKGYPVIGVVAGFGTDLARHRQRMEEAGCFEILDRYIAAKEVPDLFLDSFAVVLPYVDGTQSGVAAMALGFARPVVASAVGSIPELVRNGENGLLVPPSDSIALSEAIETLLNDTQLWEQLTAGAQRLRDRELSWESIADKTIRVYELAGKMRLAST